MRTDRKPGNVIIPTEGEVKLLDFGLAKFVDVIAAAEPPSGRSGGAKNEPAQPEPLAATLDIGVIGPDGLSVQTARSPQIESPLTPPLLPQSLRQGPQLQTETLNPVHLSYRHLLRETPSPERPTPQATTVAAAFAVNTSTDGGVARRAEAEAEDDMLSQTSTIKGTPLYMAPEVFDGEPASRRSDVYSMGALLYELCSGQPPHFHTSLQELHRMVSKTDAQPLTSLMPAIDRRFAAIVDKCLRRDPAGRYASGEELRDAIETLSAPARHEEIPEGNPYRGLLPFEAQHRALFFGRKSEIGTLIERLRTESFVLVAADSGVGKSSVCRAGVLPLVQEGALEPQRSWKTAALVPGRQPLNMLCASLSAALGCDEQALSAQIRTDVQGFPRALRRLITDQRGLLIFVDQLEEETAAPALRRGIDRARRVGKGGGRAGGARRVQRAGASGLSTRPSGWRAKRPSVRACTGPSLSHGQPPKRVRR